MSKPLKTFIIYARADAEFKNEFRVQLKALEQKRLLDVWDDSHLKPGEEWEKSIKDKLEASELVLMLVSANSIVSDFILKVELQKTLERTERGLSHLAPILVRDCVWEIMDEMQALQMLPLDAGRSIVPVESWLSRSAAWASTLRELLRLIPDIQAKIAAESAAQKEREEAKKTENRRSRNDAIAWKKVCEEASAATDMAHKIDCYETYLENEEHQNHRAEAEDAIHELRTAQQTAQKLAEKRQKAEAAAREAAENQRLAAEAAARERALPKNGYTKRDRPDAPEMVFVEGGTFMMGSNDYENEKPIHEVRLRPFWLGKYPVTFEEYDRYCAAIGAPKPSDEGWGRGRRPVINVNWHEAVAYCKWLSDLTKQEYRLPTEAEWEFAARGGTISGGYMFSGSNTLEDAAWFRGNSGRKTQPVGGKNKNELGLHDMSGNVWEWCGDWYGERYYEQFRSQTADNPTGPEGGERRVLRGGSWGNYGSLCRSAYRGDNNPSDRISLYGFRLARH